MEKVLSLSIKLHPGAEKEAEVQIDPTVQEKNITFPVDSSASSIDEIISELEITRTPERAGRSMDNETEDAFERLRSSGYM